MTTTLRVWVGCGLGVRVHVDVAEALGVSEGGGELV
jgi:hypothetical protein